MTIIQTETTNDPEVLSITASCDMPNVDSVNTMEIRCTNEQLREWFSGESRLIQDVFPDLTADEREFIFTGTTPEIWDEIFPDDEDDE